MESPGAKAMCKLYKGLKKGNNLRGCELCYYNLRALHAAQRGAAIGERRFAHNRNDAVKGTNRTNDELNGKSCTTLQRRLMKLRLKFAQVSWF